jgi:hypothetical protein
MQFHNNILTEITMIPYVEFVTCLPGLILLHFVVVNQLQIKANVILS